MTDLPTDKLPRVHLSPGQLLVTREPQVVVTVLGSCVAVTMFDRQTSLAAICHAMLAEPQPDEVLTTRDPRRLRYVSHALPAMIAAYRERGVGPRRIEVKVFGGANVIGHASSSAAPHWIGGANVETARRCLDEASLIVTAENTGGTVGRKILFNTATGVVLHKRLSHSRP